MEEEEAIELTAQQKEALDKKLAATIDEANHSVNILRVFNTYQEPLH